MSSQTSPTTRAMISMLFNELSYLSAFPHHAAVVEYTNDNGDTRIRTLTEIEPFISRDREVCVKAYDDFRRERRTFRVDRMAPICLYQEVEPIAARS
jgi:hypothetical protein